MVIREVISKRRGKDEIDGLGKECGVGIMVARCRRCDVYGF